MTETRRQIATYLFTAKVGERLPSVRKLAAEFGTSMGFISETLASLEQDGAVSIARHGHQGSFLEGRDLGGLWRAAKNEPLIIAHTLPLNRRYEGLATGLKKIFNQAGIETYLIFTRGSVPRVQALRQRQCHVTVVSSLAAQALCTDQEEIVLELPPGSFVRSHNVFYRPLPERLDRALRVAVDSTSFDLRRLSELEFAGQQVEFKETNFMHINHMLRENQVDAAIWTHDDMVPYVGDGILERSFSESVQAVVRDKDTCAALVINADEPAVRELLKALIDPDELLDIQQAVLAGTLIPEY